MVWDAGYTGFREDVVSDRESAAAALALLAGALREATGHARLSARGACMAPLVRDSDEVTVRPLDGAPPIGALVLARGEGDELLCHRVLVRTASGAVLGADRTSATQAVPLDQLLGVIAAVHRRGRVLHLEGRLARGADYALAALHRRRLLLVASTGMAPRALGRCLGILHRLLLEVRRLAWVAARRQ